MTPIDLNAAVEGYNRRQLRKVALYVALLPLGVLPVAALLTVLLNEVLTPYSEFGFATAWFWEQEPQLRFGLSPSDAWLIVAIVTAIAMAVGLYIERCLLLGRDRLNDPAMAAATTHAPTSLAMGLGLRLSVWRELSALLHETDPRSLYLLSAPRLALMAVVAYRARLTLSPSDIADARRILEELTQRREWVPISRYASRVRGLVLLQRLRCVWTEERERWTEPAIRIDTEIEWEPGRGPVLQDGAELRL